MKKIICEHKDDKQSIFYYIPNFLSNEEQIKLLNYLNNMNNFHSCSNYKNNSSRYQKWYHMDKKYFCPLWKKRYKRWESFEYDTTLIELQDKIKNKLQLLNLDYNFNSCLINKYITGEHYINKHRDSLNSFGEYPTIVGLSIGSKRIINFTKVLFNPNNISSIKRDKIEPFNFNLTLDSGSIFIMTGSSQKYFAHEIPKSNTKKIRYSFTFRDFIL